MAKQQNRPTPQQQQNRPASQQQQQARKTAPAPVRRTAEKKESIFSAGSNELIFGRQNFILMGIGLALVRQSVLAVGGTVIVKDRPEGGTVFEVRLPMKPIDTGVLQ